MNFLHELIFLKLTTTLFFMWLFYNATVINIFPNISISLFNAHQHHLSFFICSLFCLIQWDSLSRPVPTFLCLSGLALLIACFESVVTWISFFFTVISCFLLDYSNKLSFLLHWWLMIAFMCNTLIINFFFTFEFSFLLLATQGTTAYTKFKRLYKILCNKKSWSIFDSTSSLCNGSTIWS